MNLVVYGHNVIFILHRILCTGICWKNVFVEKLIEYGINENNDKKEINFPGIAIQYPALGMCYVSQTN